MALPKISVSVATPLSPQISNHLDQIIEACENVRSGQWPPEQFLESIERIYSTIYERAQEIESLEIPDYLLPKLQEQLEVGFNGITDLLDGIQEIRLYLEDENEEHLDIGIEMAKRGNENLNLALEMARNNIRNLKESDPDIFDPIG